MFKFKIKVKTVIFTALAVAVGLCCSCDVNKEISDESSLVHSTVMVSEEGETPTVVSLVTTGSGSSTAAEVSSSTTETTAFVTETSSSTTASESGTSTTAMTTEGAVTVETTVVTEFQQNNNSVSNNAVQKAMIQNGEFYCQYTVRLGDTYDTIQYNYEVSKWQVCAFNGIDPNAYLIAGWKIYIPLDTYLPPDSWSYDYTPVFADSYEYANNTGGNSWSGGTSWDDNSWGGNSWTGGGYSDWSDGLVWGFETTLYSTNDDWRSWHNINLACELISGMKLGPGESFNWWYDVGACQYDQGFIDAGAYTDEGSAPGGGICFPSTALFQGARGSGCVITERWNHAWPGVSYATPGNDAAINYGSNNLQFYNPSQTTGLQFWLYPNQAAGSIYVCVTTY